MPARRLLPTNSSLEGVTNRSLSAGAPWGCATQAYVAIIDAVNRHNMAEIRNPKAQKQASAQWTAKEPWKTGLFFCNRGGKSL